MKMRNRFVAACLIIAATIFAASRVLTAAAPDPVREWTALIAPVPRRHGASLKISPRKSRVIQLLPPPAPVAAKSKKYTGTASSPRARQIVRCLRQADFIKPLSTKFPR